jgi:phosphodiesterase/alkaline phosphatase D-like protein
MTLALVNHAADDAYTLRVWTGIAYCEPDAQLSWKISGKAAQPSTLRAMENWQIPDCKPFRSGVFEFRELQADTQYDIELNIGGEQISRVFKTLPGEVPASSDDSFNLLLLSCFHGAQDATGNAGRALSTLKPRPDLSIFAGDQVYLDLPTLRDFRDEPNWLQEKFLQDYLTNWFGTSQSQSASHDIPSGFPQILSLGPISTIPDDHEYWNNAPFSSPFIQNSWTESGRKNWSDAAERGFAMFQNGTAQPLGTPRHLQIDPLSILILDTRSQRNRGKGDQPKSTTMRNAAGDLLGQAGRAGLQQWTDDLIATAKSATPRYGVLVTGQSLFAAAAGELKGNIADFEFPDYAADYRFLMEQIERVSHAGLPVLCLTGDVHWGRILRAGGPSGTAPIYEVISSPTSLVESIGADQVAQAIGGIKELFGKTNPWPRHHKTENPPSRFGTNRSYAPDFLRNASNKQTSMRGNMALMLRFKRIGPALDVEVEYIPLHKDSAINSRDRWTAGFRLRPLN